MKESFPFHGHFSLFKIMHQACNQQVQNLYWNHISEHPVVKIQFPAFFEKNKNFNFERRGHQKEGSSET